MNQLVSKYLSLNQRQWLKGLGLAVASALATGLYNGFMNDHLPSCWADFKPLIKAAITAGSVYLGYSFTENSKGQLLKKETPTEEQK